MKQKDFILVAEDDQDDQQLLQNVFTEKQYAVPLQFVANGIELIQFLDGVNHHQQASKFPNFILLDLNMPKMDGRQVLQTLKQHPAYKKIPVVVFSTTENEAEINRCYELGANTYVVKPSSYSSLLQTVEVINNYWLKIAATPITQVQ
jgi:CheY-like chemotaxis protein